MDMTKELGAKLVEDVKTSKTFTEEEKKALIEFLEQNIRCIEEE